MDIAFISTSSWNKKGLFTPNEEKVDVKQAIINSSRLNYLVCDSSKYGKVATFHAIDLERFDKIITDSSFPSNSIQDLAEQGTEVITY